MAVVFLTLIWHLLLLLNLIVLSSYAKRPNPCEFKGYRSTLRNHLLLSQIDLNLFISYAEALKMDFAVLWPLILIFTQDIECTCHNCSCCFQIFVVFSVGYFLGFWRASHGFKSLKKENILWWSWAHNTQRGLLFTIIKQLFYETFFGLICYSS